MIMMVGGADTNPEEGPHVVVHKRQLSNLLLGTQSLGLGNPVLTENMTQSYAIVYIAGKYLTTFSFTGEGKERKLPAGEARHV